METPSPPASFRFLDLPTEIRIQIYRNILYKHGQNVVLSRNYYKSGSGLVDLAIVFVSRLTYSEAMPLFLSENHFLISGTQWEHKWLRRMRPEGRSELRNVTYRALPHVWRHHYYFFNTLSLCSQMHLTFELSQGDLPFWALESKKSLRNMHGFAGATSGAMLKETDFCKYHRRYGVASKDVTPRYAKNVEDLLQHFRAPCIGKCRFHKGREGTHTQSTIHLAIHQRCSGCD